MKISNKKEALGETYQMLWAFQMDRKQSITSSKTKMKNVSFGCSLWSFFRRKINKMKLESFIYVKAQKIRKSIRKNYEITNFLIMCFIDLQPQWFTSKISKIKFPTILRSLQFFKTLFEAKSWFRCCIYVYIRQEIL